MIIHCANLESNIATSTDLLRSDDRGKGLISKVTWLFNSMTWMFRCVSNYRFDFNLALSTFSHVLHHFYIFQCSLYIKFNWYCFWIVLMICISSFSFDLQCSPLPVSLNMPIISFKCIISLDRDLWLGSFTISNNLITSPTFYLDHLQCLSWKLQHSMNLFLQHD